MEQLLVFEKIRYQIDPPNNIFTVKVARNIDYKDIVVHYGNLMEDERYYAGLNGLYDFSQLKRITGDHQILIDTAAVMNDPQVVSRPAKTAIVVFEKFGMFYEVLNRFCQATTPSQNDFQIFDVSEKAEIEHFLALPKNYYQLASNTLPA
ncbi:hypothetical protein [Thalassotalea montiporae]